MEPFITGEDIEVRENLFGRDKEIETLSSIARRHEIAGIVAPRRFGKTCALKTMRTILRETNEDAYPVFFSAHDYGVRNCTDESYCRLAAAIATQMCRDGILPEGEFVLYRKTPVVISSEEIENYESFQELSSERQREAFIRLAEHLRRSADNPHKYLLLLLDEVDYLLLTAFESPDDFQRLRTAATQKQALVKFWVAGPASWKSMCNSVGSPGLNCGLQNISLPPLQHEDFIKMWEKECSTIDDVAVKEKTMSTIEYAFKKSGGVPFYAKFIGRQFQIQPDAPVDPPYLIVRDYLKEMFDNRFFTKEERSIMRRLSRKPINFGNSAAEGVKLLIDKGLARESGEYVELSMDYLADYLRACDIEVGSCEEERVEESETVKINELVNSINSIIGDINDTYLAKKHKFVFESPGSALSDDERIRMVCRSKEDFGDFLAVVYSMYYERSKAFSPSTNSLKPGQLLFEAERNAASNPGAFTSTTGYYRNREFFKIIEPLRAAYDAHIPEKLERHGGGYDLGEALEHLKGDRNAPETREWPALQMKLLTIFKAELGVVKREVYSIR